MDEKRKLVTPEFSTVQVVIMRAACPCGHVLRASSADRPDIIQGVGNGHTLNAKCGQCGKALAIRKSTIITKPSLQDRTAVGGSRKSTKKLQLVRG